MTHASDEQILAETRRCVCDTMRRTARTLSRRYDAALAPCGLKATQFALLAQIANSGAMVLTHLADALAMDRTTLTRNLAPLERAGWVVTGTGTDRRTRTIALTERGTTTLAAALPFWYTAQQQIADEFGNDRLATLLDELAAVRVLIQHETP